MKSSNNSLHLSCWYYCFLSRTVIKSMGFSISVVFRKTQLPQNDIDRMNYSRAQELKSARFREIEMVPFLVLLPFTILGPQYHLSFFWLEWSWRKEIHIHGRIPEARPIETTKRTMKEFIIELFMNHYSNLAGIPNNLH